VNAAPETTDAVVPLREHPVDLLAGNPFQRKILFALNFQGKHIYYGTVPASTTAKRRARNKVAKASRKANR